VTDVAEPLRIRAAVLHEPRTPLSVEEVLLDPPKAGEVLVRVAAAGVCHTDLHLADGHLGDGRWPTVLGHEGAGVVEAVGPGVAEVAHGDHVAFCFVPACRECPPCRSGRPNLCERASENAWRGTLADGTTRLRLGDGRPLQHFNFISCFAERCVVPAAAAVPVPRSLPLWKAALVGCGTVTATGAVRNAAGVEPGDSVCVIGCGGVGLQVVAAARRAGADPLVAVDRDGESLARALDAGATDAVDASAGDVLAAVRRIAGGGVRHAFEVVGKPATILQAWQVLRPGGAAVVVGVVPRGTTLSLPAEELLAEKGLRGCYYGSGDPAAALTELGALAAAGGLDVGGVVSHVADLDGIEAAFGRLRRGEGARTVAVLDSRLAGLAEAPPSLGSAVAPA
jgi:S-(hydroxymethyl)glutathione dehydrogenase / alcohol dehydrogenase